MSNRRPSWLTFIPAIGLAALLAVPLIRGNQPFGLSLYPILEVSVAILLFSFAWGWALGSKPPWDFLLPLAACHILIVLFVSWRNWRNLR